MPFRIALSGLNAASTDLEVTGHNIANSATVGFKESRAEFADVYANSIQDTSQNAAGRGVRVARVAQQFGQGAVDFTSNNLDLAISGEGFFVLEDANGTRSYTRAGAYNADRNGFVINQGNERLQVFPAVTGAGGATTFNTGVLTDLQLPTVPSAPTATTSLFAGLNLDASQSTPTLAFAPNVPASYNHSTSTTLYDTLGNSHTGTFYFRKTGANAWDGYLYVDGVNVTQGGNAAFPIAFSSSGALTTPASPFTYTMDAFTPAGGGAAQTVALDFTGTTQFGAPFGVNNLTQDGFTSGRLSGVTIDNDGVVFARFTNGVSNAIGKVALSRFNNQKGLEQLGDTNWGETFASGSAQLGEAGTASFGMIQSGALEGSNVDIAEQLVSLITAQRNFQANAEVISTADTVTQTIINIR